MKRLLRLGMPAFALAMGAFVLPASASLEFSGDYSALRQDDVLLVQYAGAAECNQTSTHFVPSFIRALDGTIIGVGYLEVEGTASGC
ncbi:hypothetical protein A6U87_01340 [Rhizobium sp. AC44/96]|uniref:hypothetical protein n=1 Tax=Rhizobium sp. AC44/96 TaxID=1841654 RepID=UPI00080FC67F|nr:hypothetical protein [Rhizobium sp. AC44/96]OCJ17615.1 hypothetical protein A6U87_01340 [Rhizobium sp. AC44/96]